MEDQSRNLNAHKSAKAAQWLWGPGYAAQGGGTMDFWDKLDDTDKAFARQMVDEIERARPERGQNQQKRKK